MCEYICIYRLLFAPQKSYIVNIFKFRMVSALYYSFDGVNKDISGIGIISYQSIVNKFIFEIISSQLLDNISF